MPPPRPSSKPFAAQFKRDEDVFKAGIKQGQLYMGQDKFEPALVAFQGAQRVAHTPKQHEDVNRYIDIIVQRQAVALAKSEQAKKAIEDRLDAERKRRTNMEDQYKLALQAANVALAQKDLKLAEAKFVEARLLYKTDAVEAGFKKIQAARMAEEASIMKAAEMLKRDETVKKMIADGNAAHEAKNFAAAVQTFQQAKKLDPTNLAVMTGLTKAEQAHNRLLSDERRKNEETGRTQTFARLAKSGRDNLDSKNYIAAIANLSEALKLNPSDPAVLADLKKAEQGRDASFVDKKAQDEAKARGDKYQKLMTDGQTALDSKRFTDAIKHYGEAQKTVAGRQGLAGSFARSASREEGRRGRAGCGGDAACQ